MIAFDGLGDSTSESVEDRFLFRLPGSGDVLLERVGGPLGPENSPRLVTDWFDPVGDLVGIDSFKLEMVVPRSVTDSVRWAMVVFRSAIDSVKTEIAVFGPVGGSLGPGVGSFGLAGDSFRLENAFFRLIVNSPGRS